MDWIVFGYQRDNNEDGLQRDSVWISDTYLDYRGTVFGSLILILNGQQDSVDGFWMPKG